MGINYISVLIIIAALAEGKIRAVNNRLPDSVLLTSEMSTIASHRYMAVVLQSLSRDLPSNVKNKKPKDKTFD